MSITPNNNNHNNQIFRGQDLSASPSSNSVKSNKSGNYFSSVERRSQSPSPYINLGTGLNYSSNEAVDSTLNEGNDGEGGETLGLTEKLLKVISDQDISEIKDIQNDIVEDVDETLEKCDLFEKYSAEQYDKLAKNFEQHTKSIVELQKDLENVFRRIRNLKLKLKGVYPQQFDKVLVTLPDIEVEDD